MTAPKKKTSTTGKAGRPKKRREYRLDPRSVKVHITYAPTFICRHDTSIIAADFRKLAERAPKSGNPPAAYIASWLHGVAESVDAGNLPRTAACALFAIIEIGRHIDYDLMPLVEEGRRHRGGRKKISDRMKGRKRHRD